MLAKHRQMSFLHPTRIFSFSFCLRDKLYEKGNELAMQLKEDDQDKKVDSSIAINSHIYAHTWTSETCVIIIILRGEGLAMVDCGH